MDELSETLERRITICARRETVFSYFTDSERFARWWGEGSRIEARPGGSIRIHYPNGITANGEVLEIDPPGRIVFTYVTAGVPTRVTITLEETPKGTLLTLHHAFTSAKIRDHFVQGWRHQLALFSKVVTDDARADAVERVDAFLRAWGEADASRRRALVESCAAAGIAFRDAHSATDGVEDLLANLEAVQVFMPGVSLTRDGDVSLSHGTAVAGWKAIKEDGQEVGCGTNVYDFSPDCKLARVVGFWDA